MANKNLILPTEVYETEAKALLRNNSTKTPIDYKDLFSFYRTNEGEITAYPAKSIVLVNIPEDHPLFVQLKGLAKKVF